MGQPTNVSYRLAVEPDQGTGWIENTGMDWLYPEDGPCAVTVFDSDGQAHTLVLDQDGYAYDVSGREGAAGGMVAKIWKDKMSTIGAGGTAVVPSLLFAEDMGTFEHYFERLLEGHLFFDPYDRGKAGAGGYDGVGYPDGLEFDVDLFVDGDTEDVSVEAKHIPRNGDLCFDKDREANRMQIKLTANMGEHLVRGRLFYYESSDRPANPDDLVDTEMDHQTALAGNNFNLVSINGVRLDRYAGSVALETGVPVIEVVAGPDGAESALSFTGAQGLSINTPTYAGDVTINIFLGQGIACPCTVLQWAGLTISVTKSGAVYSVVWADGANTKTQALTWNGTGWCLVAITRSGINLMFREGSGE